MGNFNRSNDRPRYSGNGNRSGGNYNRPAENRNYGNSDREMFPAICDNCGNDCEVPFRPSGNKPVLCSNCFRKENNSSSERRPSFNSRGSDYNNRSSVSREPVREKLKDRSNSNSNSQNYSEIKKQMDIVNAKLDMVLKFLEPQLASVQVATEKTKPVKKDKELKVTKPRKSKAKKAE
jgi:CxxC-x17-CxxC domain-containing protein